MDHLGDAQLDELRALLADERGRVEARLEETQATLRGLEDDVERQDAAAREMQRTHAELAAQRDRMRLAELDAATARMKDGSYGICEETGDEIPFGRLRIEPTTRFTVEGLEMRAEDDRERPEQEAATDPGAY